MHLPLFLLLAYSDTTLLCILLLQHGAFLLVFTHREHILSDLTDKHFKDVVRNLDFLRSQVVCLLYLIQTVYVIEQLSGWGCASNYRQDIIRAQFRTGTLLAFLGECINSYGRIQVNARLLGVCR